ncbi:hypothetical protein B5F77_04975 [Parabacteroides sp. An277]|nr:hypothetical protein B5F77_04975 [Parabacteroides sp. An277]
MRRIVLHHIAQIVAQIVANLIDRQPKDNIPADNSYHLRVKRVKKAPDSGEPRAIFTNKT